MLLDMLPEAALTIRKAVPGGWVVRTSLLTETASQRLAVEVQVVGAGGIVGRCASSRRTGTGEGQVSGVRRMNSRDWVGGAEGEDLTTDQVCCGRYKLQNVKDFFNQQN